MRDGRGEEKPGRAPYRRLKAQLESVELLPQNYAHAGEISRVIDPTVVTVVKANVAVELTGTHTRGATVIDLHKVTERQPNAQVATDLDVERFWELVLGAIAALG